jgi:hypothetical protein
MQLSARFFIASIAVDRLNDNLKRSRAYFGRIRFSGFPNPLNLRES